MNVRPVAPNLTSNDYMGTASRPAWPTKSLEVAMPQAIRDLICHVLMILAQENSQSGNAHFTWHRMA